MTKKQITRVRCIIPFTLLMVNAHGYCYSCCIQWTKLGNVGRLTHDNSIMEIWNNDRMQFIRRAVLDDQLDRVCNFKYCPIAIKNEYMYLESMKSDDENFNHILDRIMAGQTIMDKPPYTFEVANSGKCNLKCIMCHTNDKCLKSDDLLDQRLFTKIIPEMIPDISRLILAGNGEVFFNPNSIKFLQSLESSRYPSLRINLLTNGTLFTPKLWETISHNRYESISVSIDAASKETYQKIRKNGNWDILRRNLDFISELRLQNIFSSFSINFIVMKSNYKELKSFAELGLELGCDLIVFQKIFGYADIRENINILKDIKVFVEIADILTDPIFNRPEVDTTQIDEYRKYSDKRILFWNGLVTKGKEVLLYVPIK